MNAVLCRQLAIDYCCAPEDVLDGRNHFTKHRFLPGRRAFQERGECYLKIAVARGKLLFTGDEEIVGWCQEAYWGAGGAWFFEADTLLPLNEKLRETGHKIEMAHPFYIAEGKTEADTRDWEIRWYGAEEIGQFRGDQRFGEAYAFDSAAPDMLGVAAVKNGEILGMAGASADSPTMWQIGINVNENARQGGIGTMLVTLLKNAVLDRGILPFYGTSMSHIASQRVALNAGFVPAWAELVTSKIAGA